MACFRHYNKGVHTHIRTQTHTLCAKGSFCLFGFTFSLCSVFRFLHQPAQGPVTQPRSSAINTDFLEWSSIQYLRLNNVVCEKKEKRKKEEDIDRAACSQPLLLLCFVSLLLTSSPTHPPPSPHHEAGGHTQWRARCHGSPSS